ncbi:16S rRNA processing protein RimM [Stella humosa]|uniref:Ribosome maturation factor RimM n=1 Tax=Stella humosa TaxID=94 RepID=A0A3N1LJ07_9PROT|nr:16S rRNA processing protein RimM [Stella humosa]
MTRNGAEAAAGDGDALVLVGQVVGVHGVRGNVRIKSYTDDPAGFGRYDPLLDGAGRPVKLRVVGEAKGTVVVQFQGVVDRNAAETLRGTRLFVPRSALPAPDEEEFYHADLIGLAVETVAGQPLGRVLEVANYGAGDMLEVRPAQGPSLLVPFTRAIVPVVDLVGGRVVVDPPAGLLDPVRPDERDGRDDRLADAEDEVPGDEVQGDEVQGDDREARP